MRGKYIRIYYYALAWIAFISYCMYGGFNLVLLSLVFTVAALYYHFVYVADKIKSKELK